MKLQAPTTYADGKKAVLYLRVSTEEQVDNFSLNTQEEICRKEAEKRGYEIIEVFREEGRSAKNIIGRPVLISLLEYSRKNKNKFQAVFVYRLDRISRITADYLAIRKKLGENGVNIISSTEPTGDSPTEKLVETILAGFAQLDNDIRSERAKNGLKARFMAGMIVTGQAPLGYKVEAGYAVKNPQTWDKMKAAWDLMATGTKSLKEMRDLMNDSGLRAKQGDKEYVLCTQRVNKLFRNKFYMGILASKTYKEQVKGNFVPMITEQQFYKVQAILDGRNVNQVALAHRNHDNPTLPLRRIIKCALCGKGLTGGWSKGHGGKYAYYRCSGSCKGRAIKPLVLENALMQVLKETTPKKECLNLFITFVYKAYYERHGRLQNIKNSADDEIAKLQATRKLLVQKNLAGIYSDEIFKEQNALIESEMTKAQIAKDDATFDKYNIDEVTAFMKTMLADLGEAYKRATLTQAKVLIGSMFPEGLAWDNNGTLNHRISPIYQSIRYLTEQDLPSSADERS
ncbi:MAG: recombinase family protein [Candidatus Levybacteria bacterium]|nr:recombinase family protein [Candidatus Levybacteria bacterium]